MKPAPCDAHAPTETPDVSVILVGLNARDYIKQCIESLLAATWHEIRYEIIYVDNGSTDGTPEMVEQNFSLVQCVRNSQNIGFCPAANQGSRLARGRFLCFLNDDTIVLDDAVAMLVPSMDADATIGVIGNRLLYPDLSEQYSGRKFPSLWNGIFGRRAWLTRWFPNAKKVGDYLCKEQLQQSQLFDVDWVSAAGLMVRADSFASIGGFPEDYYYWHEPIFCDRVRKLGQKIMLHPGSRVIHYEGKGSGPRPYRVRTFHIKNFHSGAFRCYCEHFELGRLHPMRWFAFLALNCRATIMLWSSWMRSWFEKPSKTH